MGRPPKNRHDVRIRMWPHGQELPEFAVKSDSQQYFFLQDCYKHLRFCTVQCVADCLDEFGYLPCRRCNKMHRSSYEQYVWQLLHGILGRKDVVMFMSSHQTCMIGGDLGFVVEAKVLKGKYGAVDNYIPALNLIVQVDGQHHDQAEQAHKDHAADKRAEQLGYRVLRLCYDQHHSWYAALEWAVGQCMLLVDGQPFAVDTRSMESNKRLFAKQ